MTREVGPGESVSIPAAGTTGKEGTKACSDHFHKTMKRGVIVRRTSLLNSRHQATSAKPFRSPLPPFTSLSSTHSHPIFTSTNPICSGSSQIVGPASDTLVKELFLCPSFTNSGEYLSVQPPQGRLTHSSRVKHIY